MSHLVEASLAVVIQYLVLSFVVAVAVESSLISFVHFINLLDLIHALCILHGGLLVLIKPINKETPNIRMSLNPVANMRNSSVKLPNKIKCYFHPLEKSHVLSNYLSEEIMHELVKVIFYDF